MKIVYFGTPEFAAKTLSFLIDHGVNIVAVVTKPDRPKGRSGIPLSTPVKAIAQQKIPNVPVYQPEIASDLAFAESLRQYRADLFVVVAYGEIIKQHLLEMAPHGCINLHASLLPKYRGAAPIQRAIISGEIETGVTIIHLVKKMDAGDMIKIVKIPITPSMTSGELEENLCQIGSKVLFEVINEIEEGTATATPQDETKVTFAAKIELEDCEINWNCSAQDIHNLVRGVNPEPGSWCFVEVRSERKRLKIFKTKVVSDLKGIPGKILTSNKEGVVVACSEGALCILELQLEGKKAMSASEMMRGYPEGSFIFISGKK